MIPWNADASSARNRRKVRRLVVMISRSGTRNSPSAPKRRRSGVSVCDNEDEMVGAAGFEPAPPRPPAPHAGALPGCATLRLVLLRTAAAFSGLGLASADGIPYIPAVEAAGN